jgi:short-subunit dehydrogenase
MSKKALITGAADGIGKAIAAEAIRAGYTVIGVDVDADKAAATAAELGAGMSFILADLTSPAGWAQVVEEAGGDIALLVHNAGINEVGYFENTDIDRQHAVISLNLTAPMVLTRDLLAKDALSPDGSIVFVSSLSRYVSYPGASVYAGTKDGIASYARSLAVGYPSRHVMTVYPGPTRTAHARKYSPDNSREDKRMTPDDLAVLVLKGVEKRQRILIPGVANWAFAVFGRVLPGVADNVMKRSLLEKFDR